MSLDFIQNKDKELIEVLRDIMKLFKKIMEAKAILMSNCPSPGLD
jgi:hypothetical protein